MGRLKKDHSGWHTSGLWLKYKEPTVEEQQPRHKSKKNTREWCRGKKGQPHELIRVFYRTHGNGKYFDWGYWNGRLFKYTETVCTNCGKRFWNKNKGIPLVIPVKDESEEYPVQVKVNGVIQPIHPSRYLDQHYCWDCWRYHTYADGCYTRR